MAKDVCVTEALHPLLRRKKGLLRHVQFHGFTKRKSCQAHITDRGMCELPGDPDQYFEEPGPEAPRFSIPGEPTGYQNVQGLLWWA